MQGGLHNAAFGRHRDCIPKGPFHQLEGLLVLALGLQGAALSMLYMKAAVQDRCCLLYLPSYCRRDVWGVCTYAKAISLHQGRLCPSSINVHHNKTNMGDIFNILEAC